MTQPAIETSTAQTTTPAAPRPIVASRPVGEDPKLTEQLKNLQQQLDDMTLARATAVADCQKVEAKLAAAQQEFASSKDERFTRFAPAASALLALFALLYIVFAQGRNKKVIATEREAAASLEKQLIASERALQSLSQASSRSSTSGIRSASERNPTQFAGRGAAAGQLKPADPGPRKPFSAEATESSAIGVIRPPSSPELFPDAGQSAGSNRGYTSEREAKSIAPHVPLPDPRKHTGDIVADYNKARTMGDDGGEWFKEYYDCFGLSCTNANDLLFDAKSVLVFQNESRGIFMGVSQRGGDTRLVPALDKDLEASGHFMQGVFDYPPQITGPLMLRRPATIEQSGNLWQLRQSGEIRLER